MNNCMKEYLMSDLWVWTNSKLTFLKSSKFRRFQTMFVFYLLRKINLQVKLKLFFMTKSTLHETIFSSLTKDLLTMSMLFYPVFNSFCCYFIFIFHENADEEEGNYRNVYHHGINMIKFRIMLEIDFKHLRPTIWRGCAVWLESKQMSVA